MADNDRELNGEACALVTVDGHSSATKEAVSEIRGNLRDQGVGITDYPSSPMNLKLKEMITAAKKYSVADSAVQFFEDDLPDREEKYAERMTGVLAQTGAVIVWAGGKLKASFVSNLKAEYVKQGSPGEEIPSDELAEKLAGPAGLPSYLVHQGLDQERIHPQVVRKVQDILDPLVNGRITVFRPPDTALIQSGTLKLAADWQPYQASAEPRAVRFPSTARKYLIVVSIGHGGDDGTTFFPPVGSVPPGKIAEGLGTPADAAIVIPLQCFPQKAVDLWRAITVISGNTTSESIPQLAESDDLEMMEWVGSDLNDVILEWIGKLA